MTKRAHDPRRLHVAAAAAAGATLGGHWQLADLPRLAEDAVGQGDLPVEWTVALEQRRAGVGPPQVWMHLLANTRVWRECQRCLQPVALDVRVDRALRFAPTEDEAAALDADSEDDVLAISSHFDLRTLVEDELLLALPLVPKHAHCPLPLSCVAPLAEAGGDQDRTARPFAALAALKRGPKQ